MGCWVGGSGRGDGGVGGSGGGDGGVGGSGGGDDGPTHPTPPSPPSPPLLPPTLWSFISCSKRQQVLSIGCNPDIRSNILDIFGPKQVCT